MPCESQVSSFLKLLLDMYQLCPVFPSNVKDLKGDQ